MNIAPINIRNDAPSNKPKTILKNNRLAASPIESSNQKNILEYKQIKPANYLSYANISFKAAMSEHLGQGARYLGNGKTKFTLTAPLAQSAMVSIINENEDRPPRRIELEKHNDLFEVIVDDVKPGSKYYYTILDENYNSCNLYDPRADYLPHDINGYTPKSGLSEVIDHKSFSWSDEDWLKNRQSSNPEKTGWGLPNSTIIESIHIGALGGFKNAKQELDKIAENGIANAVRIMPIGEFYGKINWGYDESGKYAVENTYGRPEDFKDFVNHAHEKGINVILDVVPNHFGPYGTVVHKLFNTFAEGNETPWGKPLEFNGDKGKHMRSYMTDMLMNWAVNYHVDGFRLDATQCMQSDETLKSIVSDLRSHQETKDLILYPEDMRLSRVMANSNIQKEVSDDNWGFNAITTFDFYKSLIANLTSQKKHNCEPSISELEQVFKNVILQSHEEDIVNNPSIHQDYRKVCEERLKLPKANSDNMLINISNNDEIGNDAGGKRNPVNILSIKLDLINRCEGDWQQAQWLIFDLVKNYVQTGKCLSEDIQKSYGCKKPITQEELNKKFKTSFELNKVAIGTMFMHPSAKEFFMGDDRFELAPFKYFCETPPDAINPNTKVPYIKEMESQKGYPPTTQAFNESIMYQPQYNSDSLNQATLDFSKDFAKLLKKLPAFKTADLNKICTYAHTSDNILEVKRYNEYNDEVIAVINLSGKAKQGFELKTTISDSELEEVINSNDKKYNGNGRYINKNKNQIKANDLIIPPYGITVFTVKK